MGYIPKIVKEVNKNDIGKNAVFLADYETEDGFWLKGTIVEIRNIFDFNEIMMVDVYIPCFQGMSEYIPSSVLSIV